MFKEGKEGQTHSYGDNCGEKLHNIKNTVKTKKNNPAHNMKPNKETKEDWEIELSQMISLAWKDGIWHSEATLFKDINSFIQSKLSKAKEEWQKEQSGWNELKLCGQCGTMKAFTTKVCFRCTDRNEIREEEKERLLAEIGKMKKEDFSEKDIEDKLRVFTLTPISDKSIKEFVKVVAEIASKIGNNKALESLEKFINK